jgi:hypothetical protein
MGISILESSGGSRESICGIGIAGELRIGFAVGDEGKDGNLLQYISFKNVGEKGFIYKT